MNKKNVLICAAALLFSVTVHAQNSEKLTELINTENTTFGQAAYLSAVYSGTITEDSDYSAAVKALAEEKIISADTNPDTSITLAELSYICAKTSGLSGGLFYKIFPGPRYALKELKAKGYIPPLADPAETVSGRDAIALFNSCLPGAE